MPTLPHPGPAAFTGLHPDAPRPAPTGAGFHEPGAATRCQPRKARYKTITALFFPAPAARRYASQGSAR